MKIVQNKKQQQQIVIFLSNFKRKVHIHDYSCYYLISSMVSQNKYVFYMMTEVLCNYTIFQLNLKLMIETAATVAEKILMSVLMLFGN